MQCPKCDSGCLDELEIGNVIIDICTECGGVWFDHDEIASLISHSEDIRRLESSIPPLAGTDTGRHACPRCGVSLRSHALGKDGDDVIERCPSCLGTWVDRQRLRKAENPRILGAVRSYFSMVLGGQAPDGKDPMDSLPAEERDMVRQLTDKLKNSPHRQRVIAYLEKLVEDI